MDSHVQQEDIVHRLAETAEMRPDEEIAVNAAHLSDEPVLDRTAQAPDAGDEAAVLHNGMHPACFRSKREQSLCLLHGGRKRLLRENVATEPERCRHNGGAGRRHDHVENHVRLRRRDNGGQICSDIGTLKTELGCKGSCHRKVEIHEADDLDLIPKLGRLKRPEPALGHSSASAQNGP